MGQRPSGRSGAVAAGGRGVLVGSGRRRQGACCSCQLALPAGWAGEQLPRITWGAIHSIGLLCSLYRQLPGVQVFANADTVGLSGALAGRGADGKGAEAIAVDGSGQGPQPRGRDACRQQEGAPSCGEHAACSCRRHRRRRRPTAGPLAPLATGAAAQQALSDACDPTQGHTATYGVEAGRCEGRRSDVGFSPSSFEMRTRGLVMAIYSLREVEWGMNR